MHSWLDYVLSMMNDRWRLKIIEMYLLKIMYSMLNGTSVLIVVKSIFKDYDRWY
jgi:hypothetical protein